MTTTFSFILENPAAPAEVAHRHFTSKLALETDPFDVHTDLGRGKEGFVVVDTRSADAFQDLHVRGAISLPRRTIDARSAEALRGKVVVVYCWSVSCNAAAKAAVKLSALGLQVKEMVGGLESWLEEGYPVEGELPAGTSFVEYLRFHHSGATGQFRRA